MYSCEKKGGYRERKKAEDRLLLHVKTAFFFFFFSTWSCVQYLSCYILIIFHKEILKLCAVILPTAK